MKNKKVILFIISVFIVGVISGSIINLKNKSVNVEKNVLGYSFELSDKDTINKKLDGKYLNSFVTVINKKDEFLINLEGINSDKDVYIINPEDGSQFPLQYENGKFYGKLKLEENIDYGIIMDVNLVGSIRVVNNIKEIDESKLFNEILSSLGCGI